MYMINWIYKVKKLYSLQFEIQFILLHFSKVVPHYFFVIYNFWKYLQKIEVKHNNVSYPSLLLYMEFFWNLSELFSQKRNNNDYMSIFSFLITTILTLLYVCFEKRLNIYCTIKPAQRNPIYCLLSLYIRHPLIDIGQYLVNRNLNGTWLVFSLIQKCR